jgi:hypothetical protein
MNCPACKPFAPCGACLTETMTTKIRKGAKPKPEGEKFPVVTLTFHPGFVRLMQNRPKGLSRSQWIEQGMGFNRPEVKP